ncbi:LacI family DNA-binding transcriptional regulator [Massiliimalia timonensis]|uniref:LacI family DNA-binding transcriptional regulator n=1 Tax=Massiliimalia timonensis TaxID=1987501 RepID=UPI00189DC5D5|nr:LacI family DNA-binding transcriptional regulator [Massiliimalia timonensis]
MKVTLDDIARMANVSKATVSRVLNHSTSGVGEETRRRVQAVIDELEYRPNLLARGISISKTKTLGVIVPDISNPFFATLVQQIESYAFEKKYTVLVCTTDNLPEKEERCIAVMITKHVDGVILASAVSEQIEGHLRFQKYGIPCVMVDRKIQTQSELSGGVYVDNEYAFFLATEQLIQSGNHKIAFLSGPVGAATSKERIEGYHYALQAHKIEALPQLMCVGKHSIQSGYNCVMRMHQDRIPFTAVLASSDVIALGAVQALKELGIRIPEEVEVIGFDNIEFGALLDPPLTTIEQPIAELARRSVAMLLELISNAVLKEKNIRLEPKLIYRKTTKTRY